MGAIWFSHNKIDTKEHKHKVQVGANSLSLVTWYTNKNSTHLKVHKYSKIQKYTDIKKL